MSGRVCSYMLMQLVLHPQETRGLCLLQAGHRNTRPPTDDEGDGLGIDHRPPGLTLLLPGLAHVPDPVRYFAFAIPEGGGLLEVLIADRLLLLHCHRIELYLQFAHLRGRM